MDEDQDDCERLTFTKDLGHRETRTRKKERGHRETLSPWPKGRSGNPSGRRKVSKAARELALAHAAEAVQTLTKIGGDERATAALQLRASNLLLRVGFGPPRQSSAEEDEAEEKAIANH